MILRVFCCARVHPPVNGAHPPRLVIANSNVACQTGANIFRRRPLLSSPLPPAVDSRGPERPPRVPSIPPSRLVPGPAATPSPHLEPKGRLSYRFLADGRSTTKTDPDEPWPSLASAPLLRPFVQGPLYTHSDVWVGPSAGPPLAGPQPAGEATDVPGPPEGGDKAPATPDYTR